MGRYIKGIKTGERKIKVFLFADTVIIHMENLKESTKKNPPKE